jgi:hypothetical protein
LSNGRYAACGHCVVQGRWAHRLGVYLAFRGVSALSPFGFFTVLADSQYEFRQ